MLSTCLLKRVILFCSFFNDTCTTIFNFEENPYNNSLSSILPCDDLLLAKPVLTEVGSGIYNLVNEVNLLNLKNHFLLSHFCIMTTLKQSDKENHTVPPKSYKTVLVEKIKKS